MKNIQKGMKIMNKFTNIRKSTDMKKDLFKTGVLYCFDFSLEGFLCDICDDKNKCTKGCDRIV